MNSFMNNALFLFLILLLGLVLVSFLGGREGFESRIPTNIGVSGPTSSLAVGPIGSMDVPKDMFYGQNGGSAKVVSAGGEYYIEVTDDLGNTKVYSYDPTASSLPNTTANTTANSSSSISIQSITFYGPEGSTARVISTSNGKYLIVLSHSNGEKVIYTPNNTYTYNPNTQSVDTSINQGGDYSGSSAPQTPEQDYTLGTENMMSTTQNTNMNNTSYNPEDYFSSLPPGIPASQIPPGKEDLYILKSEIVPPVCPACPPTICTGGSNNNNQKPPPCPPCGRCPEPDFSCKKVPNYKSKNDFLPTSILDNYSTYGM